MTNLTAPKDKIVGRCQTIEDAFLVFSGTLDTYRSTIGYELSPPTLTTSGLVLSKPILFDAVLHYFRDLNRYKTRNGFEAGDRANEIKVGAFSMYWLATKRPIFDNKSTDYAPLINDRFAMFAGFSFAKIDPIAASLVLKSRPYHQLSQVLSDNSGSPDALVPLLELFAALCPFSAQ